MRIARRHLPARVIVFTTCIHCCGKLGTNELIEHFPVGDRLAFDSDRGRLWVICTHCSRWNLTPVEERWEAVEECERQFRAARLRAQTSNIGYAKAGDGVGLVRIGKPLRPEFAAWRYGREFSRRRTRAILMMGGVGVLTAGLVAGSVAVGSVGFLLFGARVLRQLYPLTVGPPEEVRIPYGKWRALQVSTGSSAILPDDQGGWQLHIRHHHDSVEFRGAEARRLLTVLLAKVNVKGAAKGMIGDAISVVEQQPVEGMLLGLARRSEQVWSSDDARQREWDEARRPGYGRPKNRGGLAHISAVDRLALEMALHESSEQKAVEGDLVELEVVWREAEEIAGIADDLLLPPGVNDFIAKEAQDVMTRR
ncbi:MAG: hypothetical protein JWM95_1566 [Gemmatimonadetes bacterium]|nr:hypothetical protein [Gemmatimonadota bacterium]